MKQSAAVLESWEGQCKQIVNFNWASSKQLMRYCVLAHTTNILRDFKMKNVVNLLPGVAVFVL